MTKISVIIPIYNTDKYLRRCIDSVLDQDFADYEILLIDDGSTDNCGLICDEYKSKSEKIKVIHTVHGGVSFVTAMIMLNLNGSQLFITR